MHSVLHSGLFSPLTSLPGYRPISVRITPSHSSLQLCRVPLCGWAIVCSTGSPRCGHFGNFQYFAMASHVAVNDLHAYAFSSSRKVFSVQHKPVYFTWLNIAYGRAQDSGALLLWLQLHPYERADLSLTNHLPSLCLRLLFRK